MFCQDCGLEVLHNLTANKTQNEITGTRGRTLRRQQLLRIAAHSAFKVNETRLFQPELINEIYTPPDCIGFLALLGEQG